MIPLRTALKTLLGASFAVTHAGPGGSVQVTVNVGFAGRDNDLAVPAVLIQSGYGTATPTNIGGAGAVHEAFCDLTIIALDDTDKDGALLLEDIHKKIEALVRASEKTLSTSFFTYVGPYRDFPPQKHGESLFSYTRIVTVRASNAEAY